MNRRVDKPYYHTYNFCLDCYAKFEDKLKAEGKYEDHFNKINNKIIDSRIKEFKAYVTDKLNESNNNHVSEDGDVENWVGKIDKLKVDEYTAVVIDHLESLKIKK
jgi:hypothetical protein